MAAESAPWRYQTFLLRIWAERSAQPAGVMFRLSLEDARTRERCGFENVEGLLAFLHGRLEAMREAAEASGQGMDGGGAATGRSGRGGGAGG
jgi:hypothetical protein